MKFDIYILQNIIQLFKIIRESFQTNIENNLQIIYF